jgi:broad specificity phosphatase PhoE
VRSIWLIRHGKASAFLSTGDYDQLSPLGVEQSERLGAFLVDRYPPPRAVFVGPRQRHAQTHQAVARVAAARAWALPDPKASKELDEHDGMSLVTKLLPVIAAEDGAFRELITAAMRGESPSQDDMLAAFRRVALRWIRGELHHVDVESWGDFRARVKGALRRVAAEAGDGPALVFTSAGVVAAGVGEALALTDEQVLEVSLTPNNASITELQADDAGLRLLRFNSVGHLPEERLLTLV